MIIFKLFLLKILSEKYNMFCRLAMDFELLYPAKLIVQYICNPRYLH